MACKLGVRGNRIVARRGVAYNPRKGGWQIGAWAMSFAMRLQSARPRVSDLVFQLYSRPLHPELFDVLAERRVERDDQHLHLRITRAGHVITWEHGDRWLSEVAAASDDLLPSDGQLLRYRLRGEHLACVEAHPGVRYQMSFQVETLPLEVFLHVHDEIIADGAKRGFLHNFQPDHRLALAPLGFITVEGNARCLVIHAFHTFPDEHAIVKSQSLIELL